MKTGAPGREKKSVNDTAGFFGNASDPFQTSYTIHVYCIHTMCKIIRLTKNFLQKILLRELEAAIYKIRIISKTFPYSITGIQTLNISFASTFALSVQHINFPEHHFIEVAPQ